MSLLPVRCGLGGGIGVWEGGVVVWEIGRVSLVKFWVL